MKKAPPPPPSRGRRQSICSNQPTAKEFLIEMWILNQQITFITRRSWALHIYSLE